MEDNRTLIARAWRRIAFGALGGTLSADVDSGIEQVRTRILTPEKAAEAPAPPLWPTDYTVLPEVDNKTRQARTDEALDAWLDHLVVSPRSHQEWLTWFWHGHFVVAQPEVRNPQFMVDNILLLRESGSGPFADLLIQVSKTPAMLLYLDGNDNQKEAPNENFSRELLELFALGIGNYTEADVDSGASALTGWKIDRDTAKARLFEDRHDPEPQPFLGAEVNDLAGVVDELMRQKATAGFIATRLGRQILGPNAPEAVLVNAAAHFRDKGYLVSELVGFLTDALLSGQGTEPTLMSPVQWYTTAMRATGAARPPTLRAMLSAAGQLPWYCPSVGGWPYNDGWDRSATNIARFNLAAQIAATTPMSSPVVGAVAAGDNTATAWALGLGADFSPESWAAITTPADGVGRILLALVSPEFVNA